MRDEDELPAARLDGAAADEGDEPPLEPSDTSAPTSSDEIDIPFPVWPDDHGQRIDLFLSRRLKRMSRTRAALLVRMGSVRREGGAPFERPAARVHAGERVLLRRRKLQEGDVDAVVLDTVYEDDALLAVNKPGDLVVHPTASAYNRTVIRILRARRPGQFLELIHRIDKETSGLLMLSRSPTVDAYMKDEFAARRVKKAYLAIVKGQPSFESQVVDAPMRLEEKGATGVRMVIGGPDALPAETEVVVLARGADASLVEARPHTGRQHQIRLHLAHLGHPIIGDKLYLGGDDVFLQAFYTRPGPDELTALVGHPRQALHAWRARFRHPLTRTEVELGAPLAPDLVDLARRLGLSHGALEAQ